MKRCKALRFLTILLIPALLITPKISASHAASALPEPDDFKKTNVFQISGPELIAFNGKNLYVALGTEQSKTSKDGITWKTHSIDLGNVDGGNVTLNDMTYGNKYFVAVGKGTHMMFSSKDGVKWSAVDLYKDGDGRKNSEIIKILWNGSEYIAVEKNSASKYIIWKSKDAVTWTSKQAKGIESNGINSIKFFKGNYYIVRGTYQDSSILSSRDGITWKQIKKVEYELNDIAFNGQKFVVVGRNGYELYSTDLKNWKETSIADGIYISSKKLLVIDGCFYTTAFSSTNRYNGNELFVYKSSDGLNWEELSEPYFEGDNLEENIYNFKSINSFNNTLIATTNSNDIITSTNGEKWVLRDKGIDGNHFYISSLSYAGGKYFATTHDINCVKVGSSPVGLNPNHYVLYVSDDGMSWEDNSDQAPGYMEEVYWDGTGYYSYGSDYYGGWHNYIYRSLDGKVWTTYNLTFLDHPIDFNSGEVHYHFEKIKYINNKYFLLISKTDGSGEYDGLIYTSTDGVSWSYLNEIAGHVPNDITYGNGLYIIIGDIIKDNCVISSTVYTTKTFNDIKVSFENKAIYSYNNILYDGRKYCFTCLEGYITYLVTSSDGQTWKKNIVCNYGDPYDNDLASSGSVYAVADKYLRLSADMVHWTTYDQLCKGYTTSVLWDGKKWIVAGQDSIYTCTPD